MAWADLTLGERFQLINEVLAGDTTELSAETLALMNQRIAETNQQAREESEGVIPRGAPSVFSADIEKRRRAEADIGRQVALAPGRVSRGIRGLGELGTSVQRRIPFVGPTLAAAQEVITGPARTVLRGVEKVSELAGGPEGISRRARSTEGRIARNASDFLLFDLLLGGMAPIAALGGAAGLTAGQEAGMGLGGQFGLSMLGALGPGAARFAGRLPALGAAGARQLGATTDTAITKVRQGQRVSAFLDAKEELLSPEFAISEQLARNLRAIPEEQFAAAEAFQTEAARVVPGNRLTIDALTEGQSAIARGIADVYNSTPAGNAALIEGQLQTARALREALSPEATQAAAAKAVARLEAQGAILTQQAEQVARVQRGAVGVSRAAKAAEAQAGVRRAIPVVSPARLERRGQVLNAQIDAGYQNVREQASTLYRAADPAGELQFDIGPQIREAARIAEQAAKEGFGAQREVPVQILDIVSEGAVSGPSRAAQEFFATFGEEAGQAGKISREAFDEGIRQLGGLGDSTVPRLVPWETAQGVNSRLGAAIARLQQQGNPNRVLLRRLGEMRRNISEALEAVPGLTEANRFYATRVAPYFKSNIGQYRRRGVQGEETRVLAEDIGRTLAQTDSATAVAENIRGLERILTDSPNIVGVQRTPAQVRQEMARTVGEQLLFDLRGKLEGGTLTLKAFQQFMAAHRRLLDELPELRSILGTPAKALRRLEDVEAIAATPIDVAVDARLAAVTGGRTREFITKIANSDTPRAELDELVASLGGTAEARTDVNTVIVDLLTKKFEAAHTRPPQIRNTKLPFLFDGTKATTTFLNRNAGSFTPQQLKDYDVMIRVAEAAKQAAGRSRSLETPDIGLLDKFPALASLLHKAYVLMRFPSPGIAVAAGGDVIGQAFTKSQIPLRAAEIEKLYRHVVFNPRTREVFLRPRPMSPAARFAWEEEVRDIVQEVLVDLPREQARRAAVVAGAQASQEGAL